MNLKKAAAFLNVSVTTVWRMSKKIGVPLRLPDSRCEKTADMFTGKNGEEEKLQHDGTVIGLLYQEKVKRSKNRRMAMSKYTVNHIFRWLAWSAVWAFVYPEFASVQFLIENTDVAITGLFTFFAIGILIEVLYRKIAWGQVMYPRKAYPPAIRPECPDHPWISLLDEKPEPGRVFELFCADGVTRTGKAMKSRKREGDIAILIQFDMNEVEKTKANPWPYRPTHWRYFKEDASTGDSVSV